MSKVKMMINAILSVTLILFSVIDMPGCLPVFLSMKNEGVKIHPLIATLTAGLIMVVFLFTGASILGIMGIEMSSFALAGSLIIFFIGLEMVLGIRFFRDSHEDGGSGTVVPIAFPLIAGAGTLTTLISLKTEYDTIAILIGVAVNLLIVYTVLNSLTWFSKIMSAQTIATLRKIFGILLLAIAIQMFRTNVI